MYYKGIDTLHVDKYTKYYMKGSKVRDLESLGFKYKHNMSDSENTVYDYIFPVYRYHAIISLEARFLLHRESGIVVIDVFDTNTHGIYGPWYYDPSGIYNKIIRIINRNILKEMKKMHIVKYKERQI